MRGKEIVGLPIKQQRKYYSISSLPLLIRHSSTPLASIERQASEREKKKQKKMKTTEWRKKAETENWRGK